jgi:hypothetical protein
MTDAGPRDAGFDAGSHDAGAPGDAGHSCDAAAVPAPGPDHFACNFDLWCRTGSEVCCIRNAPGWACEGYECRAYDALADCALARDCTRRTGAHPCPGADDVCCHAIGRDLCAPSVAACDGVVECGGPGDCPAELPRCDRNPMDFDGPSICQVARM